MSITNTFSAKLVVAFVAVAMLFSFSFAPASAQTADELQAQITALLAQIATLQAQLGGGGGGAAAASVCPFTWTRDLSNGSTGADVMNLQKFLMENGQSIPAGPTDYFGGQTEAALAAYQAANGISPAVGYFGPITRGHINPLCVAAPAMDDDHMHDDDANDDDANDDDDNGGPLSGGEASLSDFESRDGDDVDLEEGQNDAPVMDFEFDVEDGDVRVSRVDVNFDPASGNDEQDPWDTFDEISLWVNGDKIAEMDATDEDEWEENTPNSGDYRLRFSGLNEVVREDGMFEATVGVSVLNNVDGANDSESWDVFIQDNGVRVVDSEGIDSNIGDTSDTTTFTIDEEGNEDELFIRSSNDDPDATTIKVEDNTTSDWTTIFAFDLDTEDSVNDIEIESLPITVVTDNDDVFDDVVNNGRIMVNGNTYQYDSISPTGGNAATTTLTWDFDSNEWVIPAGDRETVEFQVKFKAQSGNYAEGQEVYASASTTSIQAEGADDLTSSQMSGAQTGETHTLRTQGAILDPVSDSTEFIENNDTSTTDNEGKFVIKFDVTAFETDIFIEDSSVDEGTGEGTGGVNYQVTSGGVATTSGTFAANLDSDADVDNSFFKVNEGETEEFTLTVEFDPSAGNDGSFFRLELYSVNFNTAASPPNTYQRALPVEDYRTDSLSI